MKSQYGSRSSLFNSRLSCMHPFFISSVLVFCVLACVLVFVIGLRSETEMKAADLFNAIVHRRGKAAFKEQQSGADSAAADAKERSAAARTTLTVSSMTASRVDSKAFPLVGGNASVDDTVVKNVSDALVDPGKQEQGGMAGADTVQVGNATSANGEGGGNESWSTGVDSTEPAIAPAVTANASDIATNDNGRHVVDVH
ncbi:hypothetical protein HPB50_023531 [Hyalomma asiaticum]|uniref:Uncharacterized protein n=1 Tax=Hyalomma asiaticum TaxID=266040 RepID=A0ACB7RXH4_HYAAI|nr:hypothetical protein HPB50_023531 [Hyalomma asiaticum]